MSSHQHQHVFFFVPLFSWYRPRPMVLGMTVLFSLVHLACLLQLAWPGDFHLPVLSHLLSHPDSLIFQLLVHITLWLTNLFLLVASCTSACCWCVRRKTRHALVRTAIVAWRAVYTLVALIAAGLVGVGLYWYATEGLPVPMASYSFFGRFSDPHLLDEPAIQRGLIRTEEAHGKLQTTFLAAAVFFFVVIAMDMVVGLDETVEDKEGNNRTPIYVPRRRERAAGRDTARRGAQQHQGAAGDAAVPPTTDREAARHVRARSEGAVQTAAAQQAAVTPPPPPSPPTPASPPAEERADSTIPG